MRLRTRTWVVAAAAAVLALGAAAPATASPTAVPAVAGESFAFALQDAAQWLPVAEEDRTGYTRSSFRHWVDSDSDGCDARREVLLEEAIEAPTVGPRCALTGGSWYSAYDARTFDNATSLDVDHFVPLAEVWDSGASAWTAKERELYANDLDDPRLLIAVSAASNRSKADKDVAQWLPPFDAYRCEYLANWAAMKARWGLTIDPTERDALAEETSSCPEVVVTGERAR